MHDIMASVLQVLLKIVSSVAIGVVIMLSMAVIMWWLRRRDQRHWEVQAQIREVEAAIREDQLSDEERAWRRLGLPEEER
jgi:type II secretory pathway pseudopilin PulG